MTNTAPLKWVGQTDGHLELIDQTLLPQRVEWVCCDDVASLVEAIRSLRVRGAPAIGIAAAYGVCLGLQTAQTPDRDALGGRLDEAIAELAASRPTAVNLFWALERMRRTAMAGGAMSGDELRTRLLEEAHAIHREDLATCQAIGRHGAELLSDGQGVLTHCNAGGLATSGYGTALAVLFAAHEAGKRIEVYADETRPLLQGSRLTAWELKERGIAVTVICDSAAAQVIREGRVQMVITGADRIAANGDTANKIGTYGLAIAAAAHDVPFYVAAPANTFDRAVESGEQIPIEQRGGTEVTHGFGLQTAPDGVAVYNPAFDITPAKLISGIICEHGIIRPVTPTQIAALLD